MAMTNALDFTTFDYHKPTDEQIRRMSVVRDAAKAYATVLTQFLPEGPDKTYCLRHVRTTAMWANVAITRHPNGTPRLDEMRITGDD
jgi:hypothetical protein